MQAKQVSLETLNELREMAQAARDQEKKKWDEFKAAESELAALTDLQKKRDDLSRSWCDANRIADGLELAVKETEVKISNQDTAEIHIQFDNGKLKVS